MDEIKKFINTNFDEIQRKDNTLKSQEEAYTLLLQISLFHIKDNPKIFDWRRYIQTYPDLKKNLKNIKDSVWHYLMYGIREQRKVYVLNSDEIYEHQFNWKDYITINQDLRFIMSDIDAFQHYIEQGHLQNRKTTIREQTILNDRIEISENHSTNKKFADVLRRHLKNINFNLTNVEETKKIDMLNFNSLNTLILDQINSNITKITNEIVNKYKNILFVCGDYPGYGGAATNCYHLQQHFKKYKINTFGFYFNFEKGANAKYEKNNDYVIDDIEKLSTITFKPDLIILKSPIKWDLKDMFTCPIYYLVGGIYKNALDKYYYQIANQNEQHEYHNNGVLLNIQRYDKTYVNSSHTQEILLKFYNIKTSIFYSSFVPYYNQKPFNDPDFNKRKYEYGLIVSNFDRKIKNVDDSIRFLKGKKDVILIGKGSSKYKSEGFNCIELVGMNEMIKYYKQIKYIVQDSYYESCSNVIIESLFNGCKIYNKQKITIITHELPDYGGSASNAYAMYKYYQDFFDIQCIFIDSENYIASIKDKKSYLTKYSDMIIIYHTENVNKKLLEYIQKTDIIILRSPQVPQTMNIDFTLLKKISKKIISIFGGGMRNNYSINIDLLTKQKEISVTDYINTYNKDSKIINMDQLLKNERFMKVIEFSDIVCSNTYHYDNVFTNLNKYMGHYNFSSINKNTNNICQYNNVNNWNKRNIDILYVSSSFSRRVKGFFYFIELVKDLPYKIVVIGKNNGKILPKNIKHIPFSNNISDYLNDSKLVINTSLFEASSNILFEAVNSGCNILTSRLISDNNTYKNECLVTNYAYKAEWINKIKFLLKNPINSLVNRDILVNSVENFAHILQDKPDGIKILVTSTQHPYYGGAATNAYKLVNYLRQYNYNTAGLFYNNKVDVNVDPDNLKGIFRTSYDHSGYKLNDFAAINKISNYLTGIPDIILCFNYFVPIISKKLFPNSKIVYMVVGSPTLTLGENCCINNNISAMKFLNLKDHNKYINPQQYKEEEESIKCADYVLVDHGKLPLQILNKLFAKQLLNKKNTVFCHDYSSVFIKNDIKNDINSNINKEFDLIVVASNWNRKVKNANFTKKIFDLYPNLKKLVIGENGQYFKNTHNTTIVGLIDYKELLVYLKKSRILLVCSLFESGPNTVVESTYCNCQVVASKNIGKISFLHDYNLTNDVYDVNEWKSKIDYILGNPQLKLPNIVFNEKNFFDILNTIKN